MLARNHPQATRITVAPVAVRAQSWAEMIRPAIAELILTSRAHQNMPPAERDTLRAAAAGTMSMAVTSRTPTACTENMTTRASRPAKRYWWTATRIAMGPGQGGIDAYVQQVVVTHRLKDHQGEKEKQSGKGSGHR
jgi:hypothetical protein